MHNVHPLFRLKSPAVQDFRELLCECGALEASSL